MEYTHVRACESPWPELNFHDWKDTLSTLHMWTQIVGKIRLMCMPWQNHSWHTTLYITARGLTTGSMPYKNGIFEIEFDFESDELIISSTFKDEERVKLYSRSVADFYRELMKKLQKIGVQVDIYSKPNEVEVSIPFKENEQDASYDSQMVKNFWQAAVSIHNVFLKFRSDFIGKCSPVHFFWGAFDIALTRFSGRPAPEHPGQAPNMPADVMKEAYSHEVSSAGFWPGGNSFPQPIFYSYCYPTPDDFKNQKILPDKAQWTEDLGEFYLTYDDVRKSDDPEKMLMDFLKSTYEAAANTGDWDREALERKA